jgi:hypothetical protein
VDADRDSKRENLLIVSKCENLLIVALVQVGSEERVTKGGFKLPAIFANRNQSRLRRRRRFVDCGRAIAESVQFLHGNSPAHWRAEKRRYGGWSHEGFACSTELPF